MCQKVKDLVLSGVIATFSRGPSLSKEKIVHRRRKDIDFLAYAYYTYFVHTVYRVFLVYKPGGERNSWYLVHILW